MATLHAALASLCPTDYGSIPHEPDGLTSYLLSAFAAAQTILDSVPPPPQPSTLPASNLSDSTPELLAEKSAGGRPRSNTTASAASDLSGISASSVRSHPLNSSNTALQKEWGKAIKLSAKENPLGIAVYKMSGKDGRGAWFARRSVHEGLPFKKWKLGLLQEFPESLAVQGGPGEGNVRGIGGEKRVERIVATSPPSSVAAPPSLDPSESRKTLGAVEVYHLSAQFPGPTTPRDFVEALITSENAVAHNDSKSEESATAKGKPDNHFLVISRPCTHPDCPPRDGFVRGQYESLEFIREIPRRPKKTASAFDLTKVSFQGRDSRFEKEGGAPEGRSRGKTISYSSSRGPTAKGERLDRLQNEPDEKTTEKAGDQDDDDDREEMNPVEWIMISRSDPGGSVPRFMVERGTPAGIVGDAAKFLDWACKKEHKEKFGLIDEAETKSPANEANELEKTSQVTSAADSRQLEMIAEPDEATEKPVISKQTTETSEVSVAVTSDAGSTEQEEEQSQNLAGSMIASLAKTTISGIGSFAPQIVIDQLHGQHWASSISNKEESVNDLKRSDSLPSLSSTSSVASYASAEETLEQIISRKRSAQQSQTDAFGSAVPEGMSSTDPELAKLHERKLAQAEKIARAKEKEVSSIAPTEGSTGPLTAKDDARIRKAHERHDRDLSKNEERHRKEVAKIESKRIKAAAREEDRRKRAEAKDKQNQLAKENQELKAQVTQLKREQSLLREQVGALQRENTTLVARLGIMAENGDAKSLEDLNGRDVLSKAFLANGSPSSSSKHGRNRSSSSVNSSGSVPSRSRSNSVKILADVAAANNFARKQGQGTPSKSRPVSEA